MREKKSMINGRLKGKKRNIYVKKRKRKMKKRRKA
jgi:hypothetical protein